HTAVVHGDGGADRTGGEPGDRIDGGAGAGGFAEVVQPQDFLERHRCIGTAAEREVVEVEVRYQPPVGVALERRAQWLARRGDALGRGRHAAAGYLHAQPAAGEGQLGRQVAVEAEQLDVEAAGVGRVGVEAEVHQADVQFAG